MAGCCECGNELSSSIKVEILIHLGELELLSKDFCSAGELLVSWKEVRNKTKEEEEREKPERETIKKTKGKRKKVRWKIPGMSSLILIAATFSVPLLLIY
jgi:hypothetical protein